MTVCPQESLPKLIKLSTGSRPPVSPWACRTIATSQTNCGSCAFAADKPSYQRVTYTADPDRQLVTLTTFRKQRQNERNEITRARTALRRRQAKEGQHP